MNESLHTSDEGLELIRKDEGLCLTLNNDVDGNCQIGRGHLVHLGPIDGRPAEAVFAVGITEAGAEDLYRADVRKDGELMVQSLVHVPLTQSQYDGLVSFTYNEGAERLRDSTLLRKLNAGDYQAVPDELRKWVYGDGKKLGGLVLRRAAEAELFARDLAKAAGLAAGAPTVDVNTNQKGVSA